MVIRSIANQVRKQCETFAESPAAKEYDFHNQYDLRCMCAVASHTLLTAFQKQNIECQMVSGKFYCKRTGTRSDHCWVEVDGNIVDITVTQFDSDLPEVFVVPENHVGYEKVKTICSCKDIQWANQSPDPDLSEKILAISLDISST